MKKSQFLLKMNCVVSALLLALLAVTTILQPALAQTPQPEVSPQTLAEQIDQTMQAEMEQNHIPGAVVVVVKDGQIIFSRGYGYASLENQIPVNPATTLWRVASVTKTFTWTAVMQQVERGNLDLDADVNQYLTTFQLPEAYGQPVTMAHLMSHTAGFEDNNIHTGELSPDRILPLGQTLAAAIPARVRAPGQVSAYSNYGAALAGYLVEQVSGVPYSQYIQENILDVLGMQHSAINEPLPSALAQDLARSYVYRAGQYQPYPYIYDRFPPAGVLNAAGEDMAAFMIAHLQNGEYQGKRILQDATARQMHARLFSQHPLVTGWAHGWTEQRVNGQRVLEHDGDWQKFASEMALFPDANLGIFVANNATGHASNKNLMQAVADLYFPPSESTPEAITPPAGFERRAAGYSGYYTSARASFTTIEKLTRLNGARELRVSDHGTLVSGREWVEVEPHTFRAVDQERYMVFRVNEQGRATHLFVDGGDFERLNWYETPPFSIAWVAACLAVFLGGLIYWPLFNRRSKPAAGASRAALWIMWTVCLLSLLVILTLGVVLNGDSERFTYEIPALLRAVLLLPIALHGLGLAAVWFAIQAWREGWWHAPARLVYTLGVLACAAFLGFCWLWNLVGWRF
ncbi:MAG: beta-lactamase family protein [Chloroflexi bacterium]|nr:beta-lactamase family protein [Chloroflexota bacterium]